MVDVVTLKRFDTPDETRVLVKGKFELVHIGGMTIGRATYVGLVLSGAATAALDDGRVIELRAGELFHIPAIPHDSWVIGDQPYVSIHFLGADHYATKNPC
jgi:hypothetical protein